MSRNKILKPKDPSQTQTLESNKRGTVPQAPIAGHGSQQ
jgi:hypothetical protein